MGIFNRPICNRRQVTNLPYKNLLGVVHLRPIIRWLDIIGAHVHFRLRAVVRGMGVHAQQNLGSARRWTLIPIHLEWFLELLFRNRPKFPDAIVEGFA